MRWGGTGSAINDQSERKWVRVRFISTNLGENGYGFGLYRPIWVKMGTGSVYIDQFDENGYGFGLYQPIWTKLGTGSVYIQWVPVRFRGYRFGL